MPTTVVSVAGKAVSPSGRVTLKVGRDVLTLPCVAERVTATDLSPAWTEVPRAERQPLLRQTNLRLIKVQLPVVFVLPGGMTSVEPGLATLAAFANSPDPVLISGGSLLESGWYRITDMPITSTRKHPVTNAVVRAEVTLSLTNEPNPPSTVPGRPSSGAVPTRAAASPLSTKPAAKTAKVNRYTVKAGDTLSKIAAHYYGSASLFPLIATANKIKNPNLIKPGQVLTIPARK